MFGYKNKKNGFTLIELLVVISIISLLSSVVLAALNDARAKARDARRMSDIKQIQNALEMYRNDKGQYPISYSRGQTSDGINCPNISWVTSNYIIPWSSLGDELKPYIKELPIDPKQSSAGCSFSNSGLTYTYFSGSSENWGCRGGQYYVLSVKFEKNNSNKRLLRCTPDPITGDPLYGTSASSVWTVGMTK